MSEETEITSEEAYKKRYDSVLLTARGVIAKVLTDDKEGSTHQRFILTTPSKQTLLILNNLERSYRLPLRRVKMWKSKAYIVGMTWVV